MRAGRTATTLVLAALGGVGVATLAALAAPLGWPFELFSHFRIQYAAAALLTAVLLFTLQLRVSSLLALALAVFNALPVAHRAQAGAAVSQCGGPEFTVVTANLQARNDGRRFIEWLSRHPADVVVVQELTQAWARDLAQLPGYPHRVLLTREDPYGIGVLSRWPLDAVRPEDLAGDGLPSLAGTVDVSGRPLRFIGLHTRWPITPSLARARDRSLDAAVQLLEARPGVAVVLGDLNTTPFSPVYARFVGASRLNDALNGARWQPTWMAGFWPLALRIDYVFVSPGLCVEQAEVGPSIGSDHRPVVARVRFAAGDRG